MRGSHLTVMIFCNVLLASLVLYFISPASASPLKPSGQAIGSKPVVQAVEPKFQQQIVQPPAVAVAPPQALAAELTPQARSAAPAPQIVSAPIQHAEPAIVAVQKEAIQPSVADNQPILTERKLEPKASEKSDVEIKSVVAEPREVPEAKSAAVESPKNIEAMKPIATSVVIHPVTASAVSTCAEERIQSNNVPQAAALVAEAKPLEARSIEPMKPVETKPVEIKPVESKSAPSVQMAAPVVIKEEPEVVAAPVVPVAPVVTPVVEKKIVEKVDTPSAIEARQAPTIDAASKPITSAPVVMGGLGPLHLLATTLCSYQPDKLAADENLNQLYTRRASVRKSLFEFMSLKFTNLEKLSSRLGYGLQVVPVKSQTDGKAPSHGWPVVGKCTAYDLKLMGEAAWCECQEGNPGCPTKQPVSQTNAAVDAQSQAAKASGGKQARSIPSVDSFLPSPEESSVISKLLHVTDIKDAPTVESAINNLNLTQRQLAALEAQATSTLECRRNALRYSKALFNHLAEDQREISESWPRLYALISSDDCARRRMIDIFNALSGFRTDTSSIRRDNIEFAFAMDDLRVKVLESEVTVPLTFDRNFIEVEQFLQQSVRLMLDNIQPKRAKLTSMRYRSLMYGASQQEADDQCIDLHQRLLARNYPNDCNPTQFGQLPDSLRMTASSLELWSIEKELSMHLAKVTDYPNSSAVGQQKVKANVNECIANLVAS